MDDVATTHQQHARQTKKSKGIAVREMIDPYLLWAIATGYRYCNQTIGQSNKSVVRFIAELRTSAEDLAKWLNPQGYPPVAPPSWIVVPPEYLSNAGAINPGKCHFVTGFVELDAISWLTWNGVNPEPAKPDQGERFWTYFKRFQLAADVLPSIPFSVDNIPIIVPVSLPPFVLGQTVASVAERQQSNEFCERQPPTPPIEPVTTAAGVTFAAVIDVGLPYANSDCRRWPIPLPPPFPPVSIPRLRAYWDQQDFLDMYPPNVNSIVAGFGYGREWVEDNLPQRQNTMTALVNGVTDVTTEEQRYREARNDLALRVRSHGAATLAELSSRRLSAAARNVPDAAAGAPLLAVQLPRPTLAHSSMGALSAHVLDGLRWLVGRAGAGNKLVVNVSLGTQAGPHNSSAMLCAAMDELIAQRTSQQSQSLAIVLAAGNSREAQCRARVELERGESKELRMLVLPDSAAPAYLEIWTGLDDLTVTLLSPSKDASKAITATPQTMNTLAGGSRSNVSAAIINMRGSSGLGDGSVALVAIAPTLGGHAEAGEWTITLSSNRGGVCDAYVERNNSMFDLSRPRGRQARLLDLQYERAGRKPGDMAVDNSFSQVKRRGTLNSLATGKKAVVAGAYVYADPKRKGRAAMYTGQGPTRGSPGLNPDAASAGDQSILRHGLRVSATRSGSTTRLNGTSIVAPRVARRIVNAMAAGKIRNSKRWIQLAAASENSNVRGDLGRLGYGVLDEVRLGDRKDDRRFD